MNVLLSLLWTRNVNFILEAYLSSHKKCLIFSFLFIKDKWKISRREILTPYVIFPTFTLLSSMFIRSKKFLLIFKQRHIVRNAARDCTVIYKIRCTSICNFQPTESKWSFQTLNDRTLQHERGNWICKKNSSSTVARKTANSQNFNETSRTLQTLQTRGFEWTLSTFWLTHSPSPSLFLNLIG